MKTVLAPIDFSRLSEHVIAKAIALARANGARLVLLHVVPPPADGVAPLAAAGEAAAKKLAQIQRSLRDRGVTAQVVQVNGEAGKCIVEQAERLSADYLVVGTPGAGAAAERRGGLTVSGVLRDAPCRVALVPAADPPDA